MAAALALKPSTGAPAKLPDKMPSDMSPSQAWATITDLWGRVDRNRKAADKAASQAERLGSAIVDNVVAVGFGFGVPLLLEAFPKIKRVGKGKLMVDTQAVIATLLLAGGIVGAWFNVDGYRIVAEAGKGTMSSWVGIKAVHYGQQWFSKS